MRRVIAGLIVVLSILACAAPLARGQATGEVQGIGFNGAYRPNAWVPMVVRLKPDTADAGAYQIQVLQHDLDGDRAVYTRPITLNGSAAGEQLFWMYFLPQPINHGLPDQTNGSLKDLQKDLVVFLCDAKGKQLAQLPVTSTLNDVDPFTTANGNQGARPTKLVLAVSANGGQQPPLGDLSAAIGLTQYPEIVNLRIKDLPEDPLGYEAVDTVLWLDGDPSMLDAGGAHGLSALQDWVRYGGQLVVTQPTDNWQQTAGFGDLLPVDVQGIGIKRDFEPLRSMAISPDASDGIGSAVDSWTRVHGPFQMARATARPGTLVEDWIDWGDDPNGAKLPRTPYLARRAVGLGQVTWVAQPLTVDAQPANTDGWPYVWLHVLGWRSDAFVPPPGSGNASLDSTPVATRKERYKPGSPLDLGYPLITSELLNLNSKGAWLIFLAVGFFVAYWLVAGPGTYGYLMAKKKQGLSWFFFAAAALVATAVTVGVVKLVLRGPPEVKHLSMVRVVAGQPTIVYTRFGLYIPRDGDQTIELENTAPGQLSYLSALAEHPQQMGGDQTEFPAPLDYDVPVRDVTSDTAPLLTVPYRSSLKKFQARWVGDLPGIKVGGGGLTLDRDTPWLPLRGTLTNDTGQDLTDVYLAFHVDGDHDWMVYVPTWAKGTPYDIQRDLVPKDIKDPKVRSRLKVSRTIPGLSTPATGIVLSDELSPSGSQNLGRNGWADLWYAELHVSGTETDNPNRLAAGDIPTVFPILSVLDRLPPSPNAIKTDSQTSAVSDDGSRVELYNRGARMLDAGKSIAAGQLVVLAASKGPLPIPIQVDGDKMAGDGTTLYQFILPIDRGTADQPATRPVEK